METENIRRTASAMMRAAKVTPPTAYKGRFVLTLLLMLLATTTAWADDPSWLRSGDSWDPDTKTLTVNSNTGNSYYANKTEIVHLVITPGVEYLGTESFYRCYNLQDVTFAEGLSTIGAHAFQSCTSLTAIAIPASVTTIEKEAFDNCTSLTDVTVSERSALTSIASYSFDGTAWVNTPGMHYLGHIAYCFSGDATSVTIDEGTVMINMSCFSGNTTLQSVTIPDDVTTIGEKAFKGCTALPDITIPDGVTTIGTSAFEGCTSLTSITIPASVTTIEGYAFYDCSELADVTFADGSALTTFGVDVFAGTAWGKEIGMFYLGNIAYQYYGDAADYTIKDGTVKIYGSCFSGNTTLQSVTIPASVTTISYAAFNECTALKNVTFADGSKLEVIGDCAFYGCTALTNITIPASVTTIEYGAFAGCSNLTDIYCYADPDGLTWIDLDDVDSFIRDGKTYIHVSADKLSGLTDNTYIHYVGDLGDLLKANAVGNTCWTTFYDGTQGNRIADTENACAYTATVGTDEIILHKLGKVIPAGTAVIIAGEDGIINMTVSAETVSDMPANNLRGVDVRTETSTLGTGTFYVMGKKGDDFGFFEYTGDYMPARKAYLLVNGGAAQVKGLTMVFDGSEDADSLNEELRMKSEEFATAKGWYSLDGRRLDGKPTAKGIFIHNGKKVVVK